MLSLAMTVDQAPAETVDSDGDQALVRAAGLGDSKAFESLYRKHQRRVYAVVWRLAGGQSARAEDLVQEAFIRAWQALPAFRFESAFSSWLHRLAVNTALMQIRNRAGADTRLKPRRRQASPSTAPVATRSASIRRCCGYGWVA